MRKKLKIIERPKRGEKMANIAHSYNTELAVQQESESVGCFSRVRLFATPCATRGYHQLRPDGTGGPEKG